MFMIVPSWDRDRLAFPVWLGYVPPMVRWAWLLLLVMFPAVLAACGSAAEQDGGFRELSMDSSTESLEVPADAATAMPAQQPASAPRPVMKESAPAPTQAPRPMSAPVETGELLGGDGGPVPSLEEVQASVSSQNRIIVRTVTMSLIAADVAETVDRVAEVAQALGGWVVGTERSSRHHGFVAIRVPAQRLDDTVTQLRGLAVEVVSESSTSDDVTDEYVDSQSLLKTLRATEESLLQLIQKAATVEDALDVQGALVEVQAEIELLLGRIKFLEQTSAFSLINVDLRLAPVGIRVDAGLDRTFSVGQVGRFRAHFMPPEGIEDFTFTWDFGDGTGPITGAGTAPTTETGQRVTATVNHVYADDLDSPYIVQLEIDGSGPAGLVEGSDTLIATVTEVPSLSVFAGEGRTVEEGQEEEYTGSFTRPEGLWDLQYRWSFGDGSAPVTGTPDEGVTKATATHAYGDYRPRPYTATLRVVAQSDAGPVEGSSSFDVRVTESQGLIIAGWSAGATARTATRALSGVIQAAGTLLIWVGIFTPVWLALGAVGYGLIRLGRYWRQRRDSHRAGAGSPGLQGGADPTAAPAEEGTEGERSTRETSPGGGDGR